MVVEDETVRRDAVYAEIEVMGVPHRSRHSRYTSPDKGLPIGGYVIYHVRVMRGGRKRPVSKGIVYGNPKNQGITQLKFQRNKKSAAKERAGANLAA